MSFKKTYFRELDIFMASNYHPADDLLIDRRENAPPLLVKRVVVAIPPCRDQTRHHQQWASRLIVLLGPLTMK